MVCSCDRWWVGLINSHNEYASVCRRPIASVPLRIAGNRPPVSTSKVSGYADYVLKPHGIRTLVYSEQLAKSYVFSTTSDGKCR